MNALAMVNADMALRLANMRVKELRDQAAAQRLARPARRSTIASVIATLRTMLALGEASAPVLPPLGDYPYRT